MENRVILSSDPMDMDSILGLGKKGRTRRKAKRAAKKAAISSGVSRKVARRMGRDVSQDIKGQQLRQKALLKKPKKAARIVKRAQRIEDLGGKTRAGRVVKSTIYAPLLPLKGAMKKALTRGGFRVPSKMPDLVPQFYNKIVKSNSYEVSDSVEPLTISAIITAIIGFFKRKKDDKEAGRKQAPIDKIIADGLIDAETVIMAKKNKEALSRGFAPEMTQVEREAKNAEKIIAPLAPMMRSSLSSIGEQPPADIQDLTIMFNNRIVKKDNYAYDGMDTDSVDDPSQKSVLFQTVMPAVIGFIGALKSKSEGGAKMTPLEEKIVSMTGQVESSIRGAAVEKGQFEIGKFITSPVGIILIAALVIGAFIALRK